jgi:hypothetical protein
VSFDKPPNQIGRRGALLPGNHLDLPENSFRKFHSGLHTDIVSRTGEAIAPDMNRTTSASAGSQPFRFTLWRSLWSECREVRGGFWEMLQ